MSRQFGPIEPRFPDKNWRLIIDGYLMTLKADDQALKVLTERKDVFSQQEQVISTLEEISKHCQEIFELLDSPSRLPTAIVPVRFPLFRSTQHAYEQVQGLIALVSGLDKTDQPGSASNLNQRNEIFTELRSLRSTLVGISRLLNSSRTR